MSAGFVMANIGLSCSPEAIGATKANTWHIPIDHDGDAFGPLEQFFSNPLQENGPTPAFITFPSLKVCSCAVMPPIAIADGFPHFFLLRVFLAGYLPYRSQQDKLSDAVDGGI